MNRMPVLFVGHGSPMNAIEDNIFTKEWERIGQEIPRPKSILCVSAHWYNKGTKVNDSLHPKTVYDMYGFPKALYEVKYPVNGDPELAHKTKRMVRHEVSIDNQWGIDHGTWSVLCRMYPEADIPVFQLSVDANADARVHYEIGQDLAVLRDEGVLIVGSGNVVHNLALVDWNKEGGFDWAETFDRYIKDAILEKDFEKVIHYKTAGGSADKAFYTPEHYFPLLYVLGAAAEEDKVTVFNEACVMGALSMTSYLFQ